MKHAVVSLTSADREWVLRIGKPAQKIIGGVGMLWYRWEQSRNARDRWIGVREFGWAHYLLRNDGLRSLYEIVVAEEARRQGVATALIQAIGFPIALKTDVSNEASNALYRALGFELIGQSVSRNGKRQFNRYLRVR